MMIFEASDFTRSGGILKPCGRPRGEGGSQNVHICPQGGGGVSDVVHVDKNPDFKHEM